MDDTDSPIIIPTITFRVNSRRRDSGIEFADNLGRNILDLIGGEPWVMLDDDWKKVHPDTHVTVADDQGFMYVGVRSYHFGGPYLGTLEVQKHEGYKPQRGASDGQ